MIEICNFKAIKSICLKDRDYIVLTGENELLIKSICESLDYYLNEKKYSNENGKFAVYNYYTKEKIKTSSEVAIFIENEDLFQESTLGSKTYLYSILGTLLKESIPIEPIFLTLNSLIKDIEEEKCLNNIENEINKFSDIKMKFLFEDFKYNDFIKKISFNYYIDNNKIEFEALSSFEKLKLYTGICNSAIKNEGQNKTYIFLFPERSISTTEIKKLKEFLIDLSKKQRVIVATFSKILYNLDKLDNMNIYYNNKLANFTLEEEFIEKLEKNYPILKEKKSIEKLLKFTLKQYLYEAVMNYTITNKINIECNIVYINDFELIFLLLFFLHDSGIPYSKDIEYNELSPFSNYIYKNL